MSNMTNTSPVKDMAGNTIKVGDQVTFNARGGFIKGKVIFLFFGDRNVRVKDETGWRRTMKPTSVLID